MNNTLDLLLKNNITNLPEKEYKVTRLSKECGGDVVFKLKAIPYGKVIEIKNVPSDDMNIHIILAGVVEPDLKNKELLAKYNVPTPAELVKNLLLAGEIEDIARRIEILSGFRIETVEELKKK